MIDLATLSVRVVGDGIAQTTQQLNNLQRSGQAAQTVAAGIERAFGAMARRLVGYFAAFKFTQMIKEAALLNARYETMGVVMRVVGSNAGYGSAQMKGFEDALRKTGIAAIEAREVVTRMAQAQLDLTKSAELARVAQDAAVVGGINSSEAFERMVYGIQSGQTEILRTIGLNVSFEKSYQKLAKQLGTTSENLTEAQKTQARMNGVMEAGAQIAGVYEEAMGTAGKQLTSMKRYTDDLKVTLGATFNEALTIAVFGLSDALKEAGKNAKALEESGDLQEWGRTMTTIMTVLADAVIAVAGGFAMLGKYIGATAAIVATIKSGDGKQARIIAEELGADWDKYMHSIGAAQRAAEKFYAAKEADHQKDIQRRKDYEQSVKTYLAAAKAAGTPLKQQQEAMVAIAKNFYRFEGVGGPAGGPGAACEASGGTWDGKKCVPKAGKAAKISDEQAFIDALHKEAETWGLADEALKRYEASLLKLSPKQKQQMEFDLQTIRVNEAFAAMWDRKNVAAEEAMRLEDERNAKIEEAIKAYRLSGEAIEQEYKLIGLSNEERYVQINLLALEKSGLDLSGQSREQVIAQLREQYRMQQAVNLASGGRAEHWLNQIDPMRQYAKMLEEIAQLEALGPAKGGLSKAQADAARAVVEQQKNAADQTVEFWRRAAEQIQDAMSTYFLDIMEGRTSNMLENFGKMVKKMAADFMAARLNTQLFGPNIQKGELGGIVGEFMNTEVMKSMTKSMEDFMSALGLGTAKKAIETQGVVTKAAADQQATAAVLALAGAAQQAAASLAMMGGGTAGGASLGMGLFGGGTTFSAWDLGFGSGASAMTAAGALGTIPFSQQSLLLAAQVFHRGGVVGYADESRTVPIGAFGMARRFHDGGYPGLMPGEVPAILERGERVQTVEQQRRERRQVQQNNYITIQTRDPAAVRASKGQIAADLANEMKRGQTRWG